MTKLLPCVILVGLMGLTKGFLFDMDLNLHARLKKGNQIPVGSGGYLRDSFRKNVLVPGFRAVEEELRYNRRSVESLLAGVTLALMIGIAALTLKLRNLRKEMITLKNKDVP